MSSLGFAKALSNRSIMSDCDHYGMAYGCNVACPVLIQGKCELQDADNRELYLSMLKEQDIRKQQELKMMTNISEWSDEKLGFELNKLVHGGAITGVDYINNLNDLIPLVFEHKINSHWMLGGILNANCGALCSSNKDPRLALAQCLYLVLLAKKERAE